MTSEARAQSAAPLIDVGAQFAGLRLAGAPGDRVTSSGLAGLATFNLTPQMGIEVRAAWFPSRAVTEFEAQGGRAFEFLAGVRDAFVSRRRWSLYGVMLPGVITFTQTFTGFGSVAPSGAVIEPPVGRATHFLFALGGGGTFRLSPRIAANADLLLNTYPFHGTSVVVSTSGSASLVAVQPSAVIGTWQAEARTV